MHYFAVLASTCEYVCVQKIDIQLHQRNCCVLDLSALLSLTVLKERANAERLLRFKLDVQAHIDFSLCTERHVSSCDKIGWCVSRYLSPRAHLDLFPCTKTHAHAKTTAAFSHWGHTFVSLSVRKLAHYHAVLVLSVRKKTCVHAARLKFQVQQLKAASYREVNLLRTSCSLAELSPNR